MEIPVEQTVDERVAAAIARIEQENETWEAQTDQRLSQLESQRAADQEAHNARVAQLESEIAELKARPPQQVVVQENIAEPMTPSLTPEPPSPEPSPPTNTPLPPERSGDQPENSGTPEADQPILPETTERSGEAPDALPARKPKVRLI